MVIQSAGNTFTPCVHMCTWMHVFHSCCRLKLVFVAHTSTVVFVTEIQISWQFLTHIELYAKELINKGCYRVHKLL